jgi:hypothetical protein
MLMLVVLSRMRLSARDADLRHQLQRFDQPADLLGWILQIRIERHDVTAARILEPRQNRHVLPGIAGEDHHASGVGTTLVLGTQQRNRTVAAAIVHENDFVRVAQLVEGSVQALEQRRQHTLFVEDGNDYGQ